jgi:periplasmic protein TonB
VPIIRFNVNDFFPQEAKHAKIRQKTVFVTVQIEENGNLKSARLAAEKAGYGFDEAALKIIRLIRFRPGYKSGRPVKMNHTLAFKFELE